MVKILSERIQSLEAVNEDLSGRLELLESHGTPKHSNVEDPYVSGNKDEESQLRTKHHQCTISPKKVAMAHARP